MTAGVAAAPAAKSRAPIVLLIWFIVAAVLGPLLFTKLPFPAPQIAVIALAVAATFGLRTWFDSLSWRVLVGMHALRLIGIVFLVLGARGILAPAFASRAGWGDLVAALGAIGLAVAGPRPKWLVNAWNTFGLLDLIAAVGTATLVVRSGAAPGVELLTKLPLNLVPTFFVPLFIASHVAVFRRVNGA